MDEHIKRLIDLGYRIEESVPRVIRVQGDDMDVSIPETAEAINNLADDIEAARQRALVSKAEELQ